MKLGKIIFLSLLTVSMSFSAVYAFEDGIYDELDAALRSSTAAETIELPAAFEPFNIGTSEVVYSQNTRTVDLIDPACSAGYYPGGRGPNKLVIYTPSYGFHTGTNEFGTEAVVEGNIVTALSGADSTIPQNGIVISGHGTAKNWITQNIKIGSKVFVDLLNNTLTVYTTSDSYSYEAKAKIDEAQSIIDYYKNSLKGYNSYTSESHIQAAQNYMKIAQNSINSGLSVQQYSKEAIEEANMAIKTSLPYLKDELKGVWLRPTETNEAQIISTLDNLASNGFNSVFLETYYHGKTIFPSETMNRYGFTVQNEKFEGFDPLAIWVKEAHKRGIKLHTWFQSFYVGNEPPENNETSILSVHPDWGNKTKRYADSDSPTKSLSEHNGYFLDPSNPYVQGFLEDLVSEIITKYHPDGINLDYIRYPNANSNSDVGAWGFTRYARDEFCNRYGVDPVDLTLSDVRWYDWNKYRRDNVTEFVRKIGHIGKQNSTYISAVIFPDLASALSTKQQDWRNWSYNNYIDGFTPLFLTYDSGMLASMMRDVMSVKSPETELYAGLFVTFMGGASEDLIRQIYETRKMNVNGIILFDYAHTTPVYTSTLTASAFKPNEIIVKKPEQKVVQKSKKKSAQKQEDKSKRKTIITTNSKGSWVFTK